MSPGTRLDATDVKVTNRPSPEIAGSLLPRFPSAPPWPRLTRLVLPLFRSRTNTSETAFVSPGTRLVASESKATNRPSAEIDGALLKAFASTPAELTLTRVVLLVFRSRTKMSSAAFRSFGTSVVAREVKATERPSAEIDGFVLPLSPSTPAELTLTRLVLPVLRLRTNTSNTPLPSPPTRFPAFESKATKPPLLESDGSSLMPIACAPVELRLTRRVRPPVRGCVKTSSNVLVSAVTRLLAAEPT